MSRVPYIASGTATPEQAAHLLRLEAERGTPVSNIFLALANAPQLAEGVLAMASSLRKSSLLSRRLRELAIVAVGRETGCRYELAHHWSSALKLGISQSELEGVSQPNACSQFSEEDRAVIRFAVQSTRDVMVSDESWDALRTLDPAARLELVITVAWYNSVARIAESLNLGLEDWFAIPLIPGLDTEIDV